MTGWLPCTQGRVGIVGPRCWGWELLFPGKLPWVCAELSGCSAARWDFRARSLSRFCAGEGMGASTCSGMCLPPLLLTRTSITSSPGGSSGATSKAQLAQSQQQSCCCTRRCCDLLVPWALTPVQRLRAAVPAVSAAVPAVGAAVPAVDAAACPGPACPHSHMQMGS